MTDDELKRLLDGVDERNRATAADTLKRFEDTAERLAADTKRHFDASTDAVRHEVALLAEAVAESREQSRRERDEIRQDMARGFADTQAMIKFSHAELERRVRSLEQSFSDLQARVERLETTTH